jgi:hypothetical protein
MLLWLLGLGHVECCGVFNVLAYLAVAVFRVNDLASGFGCSYSP